MSFKCQIFQSRLTFNNNVFVKNCDVRLIIILCVISAILPIIKCAKLENPQIRLLINDDDLLQEKTNIHEAGSASAASQHDSSGEHFNLYRSELKRLSYETIHRILRDENEPSYRREDTELRYYQKRSPSYEESHQLIKRSTKEKDIVLNLSQQNLTEFRLTPPLKKRLNLVSVLDLSHNYIAKLNTSGTTLRTLNLNNNLIKSSLLPSNIYLRNLYLSSNIIENLSSIDFSLLKNLESLDISHNLLQNSESSFFNQRMHNLKHLNLAFNQLGSIYRETFYNLLSLNTLLLSHNNISDIDYETFLALPNLQYLDLSFNGLKGKSIRALQGITGLVALNIAFNPEIGAYMQEFVASWSLKELDASGTGLCQIPAALAQSVRSLKLTHNWLKVSKKYY
ncbi:Toll-like receptor 6 [Lucilia cuprina]|nr:Toll-like receptor 6 [Lucilia cuprina]